MVSNYYRVLGVSSKATQDEIQQRYEALVLEQRSGIRGAKTTAGSKAIKTAHTVLSNPVKRERYDLNKKLIQMHEDEARKAHKEEMKHREEASKAHEKAQQYEQQEQVHREKASEAFWRAQKWEHEAQKLRRALLN